MTTTANIEVEYARLKRDFDSLLYLARRVIKAEPTMSKRKAGRIVGSARRAQMIDVGEKNLTLSENAKIRISTRKIFEEVTKLKTATL